VIIVSNTKLAKLIRAHLVSDMTPYLKGMKNLQRFKSASKAVNASIGQKSGVWAYPNNVAIDSPTKSSAAVDPDGAPYNRNLLKFSKLLLSPKALCLPRAAADGEPFSIFAELLAAPRHSCALFRNIENIANDLGNAVIIPKIFYR
jgi:hypothetical protein